MMVPSLNQVAETIERQLREIREIMRRPLDAEYARGQLTGPQTSVMQVVFRSPDGITLKDLRQRVGLAHSTTSGIVDRLVARGMLERKVSDNDRRFTTISLTSAVRSFMSKQTPRLIKLPLVNALRQATPAQRDCVLRGVETLHALLHERGRDSSAGIGRMKAPWRIRRETKTDI
jgi:DNA-binding MarR family transcriptional regulator